MPVVGAARCGLRSDRREAWLNTGQLAGCRTGVGGLCMQACGWRKVRQVGGIYAKRGRACCLRSRRGAHLKAFRPRRHQPPARTTGPAIFKTRRRKIFYFEARGGVWVPTLQYPILPVPFQGLLLGSVRATRSQLGCPGRAIQASVWTSPVSLWY